MQACLEFTSNVAVLSHLNIELALCVKIVFMKLYRITQVRFDDSVIDRWELLSSQSVRAHTLKSAIPNSS